MGEESDNKKIALEHFVYGSYEGYQMKAYSSGVDLDVHTEPFQGMFLPIKQSDVKNVSEIRMILPLEDAHILSRILKGGTDDHGRPTMANHSAIIPRQLLKDGTVSYEDVDQAMAEFEPDGLGLIGDIPPLTISIRSTSTDISEIKQYLRKEVIKNLIDHYVEGDDKKIFLYYKSSDQLKRMRVAFLLSRLIDIELNITPLAIFTDIPYGGAKNIFNLVISRVMLDIKPGGDWVMLPVERSPSWKSQDRKAFNAKLNKVLNSIYD